MNLNNFSFVFQIPIKKPLIKLFSADNNGAILFLIAKKALPIRKEFTDWKFLFMYFNF